MLACTVVLAARHLQPAARWHGAPLGKVGARLTCVRSPTDAWNRLKYTCSWEYVLCFADMQRGGTHIPRGLVKNCNIVPRMRQDDCSNSHFQAIFNLLNVVRPSMFEKETTYKNNLTYFLQPISGESRMNSALGGRLRHFCAVQLMFESNHTFCMLSCYLLYASNHTFCMLSNQAMSESTILAYWHIGTSTHV